MPVVDSHAPGSVCWLELATSDQQAAKQFYTRLFQWTAEDFPMGPEGVYTMLRLNGRDAGALYQINPEMAASGVPPHWMLYMAVESADASAAKAAELGGTVLKAPFDVFDVGRMAPVRDPTGAMFCLWEARRHQGIGVQNEPGALCWSELETRDVETAKKFYSGLFGWEMYEGENDAVPYTHLRANGRDFGGMMRIEESWGNVPPHWLPYIQVADCSASAAAATNMGAKFLVPPADIAKVGRFAVVSDPQGAVFSLFQAAEAAAPA